MKLFNYFEPKSRGVKKEQISKNFGFKNFFVVLGEKFWNIAILNLVFFATNLPVFALLAYLATVGGIKFQAPSSVLYQVWHGVGLNMNSPAVSSLYGIVGIQTEMSYPGLITKILLFIGILTVFTFGISHCGLSFVFKKFSTGDHVDSVSDYFITLKKNLKQGIIVGILDLLAIFVILFDIVSYRFSFNSFAGLVFFYLTLFISLLYIAMRPFVYLMIVTFDMKIKKMIKNASILAVAGWKRTVIGLLLSTAIYMLNYIIYCYIPALGALLLFTLSISLSWFVQVYLSYPVLKKYMIDPFYEEKKDEENIEPVFTDRG